MLKHRPVDVDREVRGAVYHGINLTVHDGVDYVVTSVVNDVVYTSVIDTVMDGMGDAVGDMVRNYDDEA